MKIEVNNTETNERFNDFKMHQSIISELVKDDRIVLTVNGEVVYDKTIIYGVSSHVNISMQDTGVISPLLTKEQVAEAIANYKKKL